MEKKPLRSPWGPIDQIEKLGPGIWAVTTSEHGGIFVSPEVVSEIPKDLRRWGEKWSKGWGEFWYEEDCCWSAVAVTFPQYFKDKIVEIAKALVNNYRLEPDTLIKVGSSNPL